MTDFTNRQYPNNELALDEIPGGLLDEIIFECDRAGKDLEFKLDEDIDDETVSLKLAYEHPLTEEPVTEGFIDPLTMEKTLHTGIPHMTFMVRLNKTDYDIVVKRVLCAGTILKKEEIV